MIVRAAKWSRIPEIPLHEAVLQNVANYQHRVALVSAEDPSISYTYGEFYKAVHSVASGLVKYGFLKGDVIAFFAPNSTDFVIGSMACFSIGAIFTGVNSNYKTYEVGHQMADTQAKGIVTTSARLPILRQIMSSKEHTVYLKTIITLDKYVQGCVYFGDLLMDQGDRYPHGLPFNVHKDLAAIIYSSGTTGLPKGVMLTHMNLVANINQICDPSVMPPPDEKGQRSILGLLPMFHVFGVIQFAFTLYLGAKNVIVAGFKPDLFLKTIQDQKITQLYLVPTVVVFLAKSPLVAKYDISSVQYVVSGGAPLTVDVEKGFRQKFHSVKDIQQGYGMAELTTCATFAPYGAAKPGSSGMLTMNTEIKIVDVQSRQVLGRGQEGEILVRGPQMMKGYLNKPEATRNTIDPQGWLRTGDVGYFDGEDYFFIAGRIKELIKHKGFQVAPAELEMLLITHPGVADAAVIGIPEPSAGELPRAFVVRKPNTTVTEEEIFDFVKERLSRHKWLTGGVQFVSAIPRTAIGKIIRRDVMKMLNKSKI